MDRNNNNYQNYNNTSGMRDRGERHTQRSGDRERDQRRGPRDGRSQSRKRDDPRSESYRSNNSRNQQYGSSSSLDSVKMQQAHVRDNSYNKQYNNSSNSSLNNATSNTSLLQSPFSNPYKMDASKTSLINDPSKDRLETYAKLKQISPVKFYISIGITIIITVAVAIIGLIAMVNNGLSAKNIYDVTQGMAQGYLFYCGFLLLAILTGVYAFVRKWNNLLVTYLSFLFVSCLYLSYFTFELINIKSNTLEVMNKRWKDSFSDVEKSSIQVTHDCCGYYNEDDDPGKEGECNTIDNTRKRSFNMNFFNEYNDSRPVSYGNPKLRKRLEPEDGSCSQTIRNTVNSKLMKYIIVLGLLLVLNIVAVVVTILDIKQYAVILRELSNPFA